MTIRLFALLLTTVALLGPEAAVAKKPEIVRVSQDTYMILKVDHRGGFGNIATVKVAIIKQANEFAEAQGKLLIPVSCKEKPLGGPGSGASGFASFEYQFKLVAKDDPAAKSATLGPCPDAVIQSTQSLAAQVTVKSDAEHVAPQDSAPAKPVDLYTELLKLDDLRKRGLITDAEFEAQKQKLLNPTKEEKQPEQQ